jgi:hypothetical protein
VIAACALWFEEISPALFSPGTHQLVIAGLDPAIHLIKNFCEKMDARVEPGHDEST